MEKLIIENFAIIDKIELEISKFMLFIGPQASGKSLISKINYFMSESITSLFTKNLMNMAPISEFEKSVKREFENLFPSYLWCNDKFLIIRKYDGNVYFTISRSRNKTKNLLNFKYSEKVLDLYKELLAAVKTAAGSKESPLFFYVTFYDIIRKHYSEPIDWMKQAFFIPAGRSFFSAIHDNLFTLLASDFGGSDELGTSVSLANIDPFMKIFGRNYESVKNRVSKRNFLSEDRVQKILKGSYIRERGKDFIVQNGKRVKVENSSSGQQEVLPMLMTILYFASQPATPLISQKMFIIEEPEAHIFPESQKQIVDLVSSIFNENYKKVNFLLTTHSPYVATSLNNVIMKSGRKGINYNKGDFAAYAINNGALKNIVDEETGLIDAEIIDSVSNVIASEFDALLD